MDGGPGFVDTLVAFGRALRDAGVSVGTGDVLTYCDAMTPLDPTDLVDLYWAGRATLVSDRDQIPTYDAVFRAFFLGKTAEAEERAKSFTPRSREDADSVLQMPENEPGEDGPHEEREAMMGRVASDVATSKAKAFSACTPEELDALRRIMRTIKLTPPRRRTRRLAPTRAAAKPDLRRTVRAAMRRHGEPLDRLLWRERRHRLRPLTLVLDVSGSMADYSRNLLQFAYSTTRAADRVEVFCFGSTLTRITREIDQRRPDDALARAAGAVTDWEGGTRIGACLDQFVTDWARPGKCRGGIVVICSDGLDRGDPEVLDRALERLGRLCHRIVWLNPLVGDVPDLVPNSLGMMVAAPHVDLLATCHDLPSLQAFAHRLPQLT